MPTKTAGGVVLNKQGEVLIVSQNGDSWSLPKGHIDPGEEPLFAAMREIKEESGLEALEFIKELGTYKRYRIGPGGVGEDKTELKEIVIFLFATTETKLKPEDPQNPEAKWVAKEAVPSWLTHPKDREFFQSVLSMLN